MPVELNIPDPNEIENLNHLDRIAQVMSPDPAEWSFSGQIYDLGNMTGHCSCGHAIRYEFIVEHPDGRTAPIGSTCIATSVPWLIQNGAGHLAEQLQAALEAHADAKKEALKRLRDAKASDEVQILEAWWDAILKPWWEITRSAYGQKHGRKGRRWDYKTQTYYEHTYCFYPRWLETLPRITAQSTPGRTASSIRAKVATLAKEAFSEGYSFPEIPSDDKLFTRISKRVSDAYDAKIRRLNRELAWASRTNNQWNNEYVARIEKQVEDLDNLREDFLKVM